MIFRLFVWQGQIIRRAARWEEVLGIWSQNEKLHKRKCSEEHRQQMSCGKWFDIIQLMIAVILCWDKWFLSGEPNFFFFKISVFRILIDWYLINRLFIFLCHGWCSWRPLTIKDFRSFEETVQSLKAYVSLCWSGGASINKLYSTVLTSTCKCSLTWCLGQW